MSGSPCWRQHIGSGSPCWRQHIVSGSPCWRQHIVHGLQCSRKHFVPDSLSLQDPHPRGISKEIECMNLPHGSPSSGTKCHPQICEIEGGMSEQTNTHSQKLQYSIDVATFITVQGNHSSACDESSTVCDSVYALIRKLWNAEEKCYNLTQTFMTTPVLRRGVDTLENNMY